MVNPGYPMFSHPLFAYFIFIAWDYESELYFLKSRYLAVVMLVLIKLVSLVLCFRSLKELCLLLMCFLIPVTDQRIQKIRRLPVCLFMGRPCLKSIALSIYDVSLL